MDFMETNYGFKLTHVTTNLRMLFKTSRALCCGSNMHYGNMYYGNFSFTIFFVFIFNYYAHFYFDNYTTYLINLFYIHKFGKDYSRVLYPNKHFTHNEYF